jgi:hypothetical protein
MAANTGILTYNNGYNQTKYIYFAPTSTIATTQEPLATYYCFLSRVIPWTNEELPPAPLQDTKSINQVFKNMFVAKKITSNDISPVIERIDWLSGEVYSYYQDDVNMFELDINGTILRRFYVKNRFDQVFKCLWNANGAPSTVEPYFEPGTFNDNLIFQGNDDYKWKYMYTITAGSKLKFMDDAWMPVPVANIAPNPIYNTAGSGSIDVINVTYGGTGYDPSNSQIFVTVTGPNTSQATANATVVAGQITDIVVANKGSNYVYANVVISSANGSGATAIAPVSPIGGHGYSVPTELGARHVMLTVNFSKDENGNLPTNIDFRQIGVLVNPLEIKSATSYGLADNEIYKLSTDYIVSPGFGNYITDEIVYQSGDGTFESATFTATVLSFDDITNRLRVINTNGTANSSQIIYGQTSSTARVITKTETPELVPFSGYITYIENREPVARDPDGSEQFRLVLGY